MQSGQADKLIAALLAVTAAVLPLLFSIATIETFVIPKLTLLVAVTGVGIGGSIVAIRRGRRLQVAATDIAVFVFFGLVMLSLVFSIDRGQSFLGERFQRQGLLATLLYTGAYYLARISIFEERRLQLLCQGIALGATVVGLYALLQRLGADPIWGELPNGRVFSTIGQPNALAGYLAMAVPFTAANALSAPTVGRVARWAVAIAVQVVALILTLSRGGYLGLAVGTIVMTAILLRRRIVQPGRLGFGFAAIVATALILAGTVGPARDVAESVVKRTVASAEIGVPGSVQMHLDLWKVGWHVMAENPLLGSGPDTFALVFPDYRDDVLERESARQFAPFRVESPHNVYLAIGSGSGVLALAAYTVLIAQVLRSAAIRQANTHTSRVLLESAAVAAILSYLVVTFFQTADLTSTWIFWLLLGSLSPWSAVRPRPTRSLPAAGYST